MKRSKKRGSGSSSAASWPPHLNVGARHSQWFGMSWCSRRSVKKIWAIKLKLLPSSTLRWGEGGL
eukprot:1788787-Karenia_brevis.AAC.1